MDNLDSRDLRRIAKWKFEDHEGLMELIHPVFSRWGRITKTRAKDYDEWVISYELATGGWSGCEQIIRQLRKSMFWIAYWHKTQRGGLHVFHVPKPKAVPAE